MRRFVLMLVFMAGFALPAFAEPQGPRYVGEARPGSRPGRVVSLAPNLTEILFSIGAGDRVVGVTRFDDYPQQVKDLPRVGGFIDPSLEAILGLKPDLVVCVPNSGNHKAMQTLSRMQVPVLVLPAYDLDDVYAAISTLGELTGRSAASAELVRDMRVRAEAVAERSRSRIRPKVLLVYGHRPLVAAGGGSFAHELLTKAGGDNVVSDSKVRYPSIPDEALIQLAPEVILDASSSGSGAVLPTGRIWEFWKRFPIVPAVKEGRVHVFDSALWFRPGPRLIEGLEQLERILHPKTTDSGNPLP